MAKTNTAKPRNSLDDAAGAMAYAAESFEALQALFLALGDLKAGDTFVFEQMVKLGAGMAEDAAAYFDCKKIDFNREVSDVAN
ncbi:hypothetical protein K7G19_19720 [Cupriavidus sp. DB3]|uniref:hypothetical protein n=1 Tax=Cupriavidus sp. DB3 TaxID=2873259 RepID=UPI001CF421B7|nr:hypothetical protein [Cupriavidus sp. DB3]MCA7085821.1 hypothetical protein [Cupriavidus sp. DB3]